MKTVTLVDTRHEIAGESIGTVVSTHDTILAAFKANGVRRTCVCPGEVARQSKLLRAVKVQFLFVVRSKTNLSGCAGCIRSLGKPQRNVLGHVEGQSHHTDYAVSIH
jgi:hypothetical protein